MFAKVSVRIFLFLTFTTHLLLHQICSTNITPQEFDARHLISLFEYSRKNGKHVRTLLYDPEENFTILKFLSLCNVKRKQLKTIALIIFCQERTKEYNVRIRNVNLEYGRFVHSGYVRNISEIRFFCKYYLVDNSYEIISCYDKSFSFGPFFFGFEIGKYYTSRNARYGNVFNDNIYKHNVVKEDVSRNDDYSTLESRSIPTSSDGRRNHDMEEIGNEKKKGKYYCKLKMLVNSYITTEEEKLLKIMTGLCIVLGFEKQFFMSSNIYPIMMHYEPSISNKLVTLGYRTTNSALYASNVVYILRGFNFFVNTNESHLMNNIVPTAYLQFKTQESYLLWRGIKADKELFNRKLLELKGLLNQINFKERIKRCYEGSLINYYMYDEVYLSSTIKNVFRATHFKKFSNNDESYNKINKHNESNREKEKEDEEEEEDDEKTEKEKEKEKDSDSFLTIFNLLCGDEKVTSFEECIYRIVTSTSLDEKSKSAFHQLMYDALLCLETCLPINNLQIFNSATINKKLQEYVKQTKAAVFKTNDILEEDEAAHRSNNINISASSDDNYNDILIPQDENIKLDFFENLMFFFEYHSIIPLLKDKLDRIKNIDDLEQQICNIGKFLKKHGKVYTRNYQLYKRKLEESDEWNDILLHSFGNLGLDSILKTFGESSKESNLNLFTDNIKDQISEYYEFGKDYESNEIDSVTDEDAENVFVDDEFDDSDNEKFEEVQREKGKLISHIENDNEEDEADNAEIDSLNADHSHVLSVLPFLLKINKMLHKKKKKKKEKVYDSDYKSFFKRNKVGSFFMNVNDQKVHILETNYEYEILEKLFLDKTKNEEKANTGRRSIFFDYVNNYDSYNFSVNDVPSKRLQLLQLTNYKKTKENENNHSNIAEEEEEENGGEEEEEFIVEEKNTLNFVCAMNTTWPISKTIISFYRSNSVYCEAEYDKELLIEVGTSNNLFRDLLEKINKNTKVEHRRDVQKGGTQKENNEKENEFFFVDKVFHAPYKKVFNTDNKVKDEDNKNENRTKMSKLIGFNLFNDICAVKYVGSNNVNIHNPYLNHVLLKTVFGFCVLHGFSVLRIETEIINTETGIKNKFLEILTNGKTEYDHLNFQLMNVAVFPKEKYYITNGYLPNTNKFLTAYLKFQKNFHVHHNIDNNFFQYMNKEAIKLLHNLTFNCGEQYEPYMNCYELYPAVRKGSTHMCQFERDKTFIELNTYFPNECRLGQTLRNCYKQIKKYIPCFKHSEGCKYYRFLIDTFIVPKKEKFLMEHTKTVTEYLSKKAYVYYYKFLDTIKKNENNIHEKVDMLEKNEKIIKIENKGENEDSRRTVDNDSEDHSEQDTQHIKTDAEAYQVLSDLIQNSTYFTFWHFSTEYWKRLRYIHDMSTYKNDTLYDLNRPVQFCPVAYAYEFLYHLNIFYVSK